jgi:hypothetical protein
MTCRQIVDKNLAGAQSEVSKADEIINAGLSAVSVRSSAAWPPSTW